LVNDYLTKIPHSFGKLFVQFWKSIFIF
jgi:hypothetical protein